MWLVPGLGAGALVQQLTQCGSCIFGCSSTGSASHCNALGATVRACGESSLGRIPLALFKMSRFRIRECRMS